MLFGFENLIMVERLLDPWWAPTARINRPSLVEDAVVGDVRIDNHQTKMLAGDVTSQMFVLIIISGGAG